MDATVWVWRCFSSPPLTSWPSFSFAQSQKMSSSCPHHRVFIFTVVFFPPFPGKKRRLGHLWLSRSVAAIAVALLWVASNQQNQTHSISFSLRRFSFAPLTVSLFLFLSPFFLPDRLSDSHFLFLRKSHQKETPKHQPRRRTRQTVGLLPRKPEQVHSSLFVSPNKDQLIVTVTNHTVIRGINTLFTIRFSFERLIPPISWL